MGIEYWREKKKLYSMQGLQDGKLYPTVAILQGTAEREFSVAVSSE